MILPSTLVVQADAIDKRLGPIPGPLADRIATLLRESATTIAVLRGALDGLVNALAENDEDGLTEFAEPMCAARAALK